MNESCYNLRSRKTWNDANRCHHRSFENEFMIWKRFTRRSSAAVNQTNKIDKPIVIWKIKGQKSGKVDLDEEKGGSDTKWIERIHFCDIREATIQWDRITASDTEKE